MLVVIRLIMVVINSISLSSVVSLIKSDITLISSVMDFHRLSQYSRRILVRVLCFVVRHFMSILVLQSS